MSRRLADIRMTGEGPQRREGNEKNLDNILQDQRRKIQLQRKKRQAKEAESIKKGVDKKGKKRKIFYQERRAPDWRETSLIVDGVSDTEWPLKTDCLCSW